MSTGGIRNSEHPDIILFPINTLSRLAEQCALRCRADLSDTRLRTCMCCLLLCWVPALCKHGVRKHWFFKVSALRWVGACCCLFPVAPACFPCVFFSVVFACDGGLVGLYEGHHLLNRQRLPTAAGLYQFCCWVYYVLIFLLCTLALPACSLWCTHPGSFSGTLSVPQFTTGTPTVGLEPTTTRLRALRSTD